MDTDKEIEIILTKDSVRVGNGVFLYTGAYLDYFLNDPAKNQRKPFANYIEPEYLTNLALLAFADNINIMSAGVKLRLAFFRSDKPRMIPCSPAATPKMWKAPKRKRPWR